MPIRSQSGAALLVTLILIAMISLLAFSGSQNTRLQQRLISNDQATQIAFQSAEAALREGLAVIESSSSLVNFCNGVSSRYVIATSAELNDDDADTKLAEKGVSVDFSLGDSQVTPAKNPRYVIGCVNQEAVPDFVAPQGMVVGQSEVRGNDYYFFRIFARGFGPSGKISRTLEARYVLQ